MIPRSSRTFLAVVGAALVPVAIAAPAGAAAKKPAPQTRVVVSVDQKAHALELVDAADKQHKVALVRWSGKVAGKLTPGATVRYVVKGKGAKAHAEQLKVVKKAARITVRGKVVRKGKGVAVRLADGKYLGLAAGKTRAAGTSLVLQGFDPGQTVEVSIVIGKDGDQQVTIRIVHGSSVAARAGDPISVEGDVTRVSDAQRAFLVRGTDGRTYAFVAGRGFLNALSADDHVVVIGHYTPDLTPKADFVDDQTTDDAGDDTAFDVYGSVTAADADKGLLSVDQGDGEDPIVLEADADVLGDTAEGDCVHVAAHLDDNGDAVADTVEQDDTSCTLVGEDVDVTGTVQDSWTNDDGTVELIVADEGGRTVDFHADADQFDSYEPGDCVEAGGTYRWHSDTDADLTWVDASDACSTGDDGDGGWDGGWGDPDA